jgi:hypothetical protein
MNPLLMALLRRLLIPNLMMWVDEPRAGGACACARSGCPGSRACRASAGPEPCAGRSRPIARPGSGRAGTLSRPCRTGSVHAEAGGRVAARSTRHRQGRRLCA